MKKLIVPFIALFVVAVTLVSWRVASSKVDGANVIQADNSCVVYTPWGFILADLQAVTTPNGNGKLTCKGSTTNPTGKAVNLDFDEVAIGCGTPAGFTTDWHTTISASGNVTLTCWVH